MKKVLLLAFFTSISSAYAVQPLKEGIFTCDVAKSYNQVKLVVKRHPTKPHKIILNWAGSDRILHNEVTLSGALRYEGSISKLVYIQTPSHSVLLDHNTMSPILTDCKL